MGNEINKRGSPGVGLSPGFLIYLDYRGLALPVSRRRALWRSHECLRSIMPLRGRGIRWWRRNWGRLSQRSRDGRGCGLSGSGTEEVGEESAGRRVARACGCLSASCRPLPPRRCNIPPRSGNCGRCSVLPAFLRGALHEPSRRGIPPSDNLFRGIRGHGATGRCRLR